MPMVTVQTIKGVLDDAAKVELLDALTDLMVRIEGRGDETFRQTVWVRIDEQEPAHWSMAGVRITLEMIAQRFPPR